MNRRFLIGLGFIVIVLLLVSGCQKATTPPAQPTLAPTNATEPTAYPASVQQVIPMIESYPAATEQAAPTEAASPAPTNVVPTEGPYPAPQSGSAVAWSTALQLIVKGEVTKIDQTQGLVATLTLTAGEIITTTTPAADSVQNAIKSCGDLCKDVIVTGP
jgi:PBP1b-binding outer membrane lipoprotein LpoB